MAAERLTRRLAAIVAADVVGYSRMMETDEAGTHARLKSLRYEVFEPITERYGGRIFKNTGDGALVEFPSAVDAVQCSSEIQTALAERNANVPEDRRFLLRVGISLGDVIVDGDDLYGNGVNVAARMETLADPGGICVSGNVHEHVAGTLDLAFEDLGPQSIKNIDRLVPAYRLTFEASAPPVPSEPTAPALALPDKPSIAVLPFQNMSGDPEQEFFADGMAEDITTALSRHRSLFVIARNSSFSYKGTSPDIRTVARELGVRYVVEGSVRKGGNRVRITAQLIEGTTGNHIWAERYDRTLDDIFAVQDEITQEITSHIGPEIDQAERDRVRLLPPENLDVWESYQRGLWHMYRFDVEDNAEAQRLFCRAIDASSTFAPAHAGLTHALYYAYMHGHSEDRQATLDQAYATGRAAIAADERDADAHFALGRILYLRRELAASLKEFETAIAQNPNFAHAHLGHGTALVFDGQWERSIEACDRAVRLSPHDPVMWTILIVKALSLVGLERYMEAVAVASESVRQPTAPWTTYMILASALGFADESREASDILAKINEMKPDFSVDDVRRTLAYRDPAHLDHIINGLRKAGLAT